MAGRLCSFVLSDSAAKRLEHYAKLHGEKFEDAAVRAIENWLDDVGDILTRIKEAQRAHAAATRDSRESG